jgi:adenine-specific DNA methylase
MGEHEASSTKPFTRQAIPVVWDFVEASFVGEQAGDHSTTLNTMVRVIDQLTMGQLAQGQVERADAANHPLPDQSASVWFTDPPYYDAVPYADLSDFFLVWLKRTLPGHPLLHDPFDPENPLSPKTREAVQDETKRQDGRPKDRPVVRGDDGESVRRGAPRARR